MLMQTLMLEVDTFSNVSQSVLYIFSSRLGLISDVWPHCVASNQHDNPVYNSDKR